MPKIFDNIHQDFLPTLQETIKIAYRADFCIGYFRLSGWLHLDTHIDNFSGGEGNCCRLLVGINRDKPEKFSIDNRTAIQFKKELAADFRQHTPKLSQLINKKQLCDV